MALRDAGRLAPVDAWMVGELEARLATGQRAGAPRDHGRRTGLARRPATLIATPRDAICRAGSAGRRMFDARAQWSLQEAKNRFSAVVAAALAGTPQFVTRRGRRAVVVLAVERTTRGCGSRSGSAGRRSSSISWPRPSGRPRSAMTRSFFPGSSWAKPRPRLGPRRAAAAGELRHRAGGLGDRSRVRRLGRVRPLSRRATKGCEVAMRAASSAWLRPACTRAAMTARAIAYSARRAPVSLAHARLGEELLAKLAQRLVRHCRAPTVQRTSGSLYRFRYEFQDRPV